MDPYVAGRTSVEKYTHLSERGTEEVRKRYRRLGFQEPHKRVLTNTVIFKHGVAFVCLPSRGQIFFFSI